MSGLQWRRIAVTAWCVLVAAVCVKTLLWPQVHNVVPIYLRAAANWRAGAGMYGPGAMDRFRYSPLVAVVFVPFQWMPAPFAAALWRLLSVLVFLGGMRAMARTVFPQKLRETEAAILYLLALPLTLVNFGNGQTNGVVIAALMFATACFAKERFLWAALLVAVASAFKIYPLATGLLFVVLEPKRFGWRMLMALGVVLLLPFLFQNPHYVAVQYGSWVRDLQEDGLRPDLPLHIAYRDLRLILRVCGTGMSSQVYLGVEAAGGCAIAVLCVAAKIRGVPKRNLLTALLALAVCWMTLLGPATENSTYILLAPVAAWVVLVARQLPVSVRLCAWLSYGILIFNNLLGAFPAAVRELSSHLALEPVAAAFLAAAFCCYLLQTPGSKSPEAVHPA